LIGELSVWSSFFFRDVVQTLSLAIRLVVIVVIATATLLAVVTADQVSWDRWDSLVAFFGMMVLASSVRMPDPRGRSITPSTVLTYLAIYTFNPPTTLLVVGAARTLGYVVSKGWVPWRAIFNGSQAGLSAALGAAAYGVLGGKLGTSDYSAYVATVVGPLVHQAANNFFVAFGVSRDRGTPFLSTWLGGILDLFWPNLLSVPTAVVLAILLERLNYAVVLAYVALLPFQWMALRHYLKRRRLFAQIVDGLVVATDANFPMGRGHARRVADLSVAVAREMRLAESFIEMVQFAALLHDVGMIGRDDLLAQPVLDERDVQELREHVRVGAAIARELPRKEIAEAILYHHERFDGNGYPRGLKGEAIPLGARIIALAEEVDSMAHGVYPFSSPSPLGAVVSHVVAERGRSFDPGVVDAFLRGVRQGLLQLDNYGDVQWVRSEMSIPGELPAQ